MSENPFLLTLLAYQQDGSLAIDSPLQWLEEPPLQIETDVISLAKSLSTSLLGSGRGKVGRWHFFVGAPGNGKSAATGVMVRGLLQDKTVQIRTPDGLAIDKIPHGRVPIVLEVYEKKLKQVSALIAQDASVVNDPFAADPDPASDFLDLLLKCHDEGLSFVACTNRGILERAAELAEGRKGISRDVAIFLRKLAAGQQDADKKLPVGSGVKRPRFTEVLITTSSLDSESLLYPSSKSISLLLDKVTDESKWTACEGCEARAKCPFRTNRDWLANNEFREKFIHLLQDAELISGQQIVFREANALLSLILAGCPGDYREKSPCSWVIGNHQDGNWFSLASRRLHMLLFSAHAPLGLEPAPDNERQLSVLREIVDRAGLNQKFILPELYALPSMDVGLARLLGPDGVFQTLDPLSRPLSENLSDKWESGFAGELDKVSELESSCQDAWAAISDAINEAGNGGHEESYALARWRSAHSIRLGAIITLDYPFHEELEIYRKAVGIGEQLTPQEMNGINAQVADILRSGTKGLPISDCVALDESWVGANLAPKVDWTTSKDSRRLVVVFGRARIKAPMSAEAFAWLYLKIRTGVLAETFPQEWIEASKEALGRAAVIGQYSKARDIALLISTPNGEVIRLEQLDGGGVFAVKQ